MGTVKVVSASLNSWYVGFDPHIGATLLLTSFPSYIHKTLLCYVSTNPLHKRRSVLLSIIRLFIGVGITIRWTSYEGIGYDCQHPVFDNRSITTQPRDISHEKYQYFVVITFQLGSR